MKPILSLDQLKQDAVRSDNQIEVIGQSLYSFIDYPTDEAKRWDFRWPFFQNAVGQSVTKNDPTIAYTWADTNMELPGTIPAPRHFVIQSLRLVCLDDGGRVRLKYYRGSLELFKGSRIYERQPLDVFSVAPKENRIPIDPFIVISPMQNFCVQVKFAPGREPARAGVFLEGLYYRSDL